LPVAGWYLVGMSSLFPTPQASTDSRVKNFDEQYVLNIYTILCKIFWQDRCRSDRKGKVGHFQANQRLRVIIINSSVMEEFQKVVTKQLSIPQ
jgi:hypothetical protein